MEFGVTDLARAADDHAHAKMNKMAKENTDSVCESERSSPPDEPHCCDRCFRRRCSSPSGTEVCSLLCANHIQTREGGKKKDAKTTSKLLVNYLDFTCFPAPKNKPFFWEQETK